MSVTFYIQVYVFIAMQIFYSDSNKKCYVTCYNHEEMTGNMLHMKYQDKIIINIQL